MLDPFELLLQYHELIWGKNKVREDIERKVVVYMYILERNDADEYFKLMKCITYEKLTIWPMHKPKQILLYLNIVIKNISHSYTKTYFHDVTHGSSIKICATQDCISINSPNAGNQKTDVRHILHNITNELVNTCCWMP